MLNERCEWKGGGSNYTPRSGVRSIKKVERLITSGGIMISLSVM